MALDACGARRARDLSAYQATFEQAEILKKAKAASAVHAAFEAAFFDFLRFLQGISVNNAAADHQISVVHNQ